MSVVGSALLGVQGLLGLGELAAGGTKLVGVESQIETFEHLGYPQWFRLVTGGLEVLAGVALLVSFLVAPTLALAGGLLALVVLIGALASHLRVGDEPSEMVPAAVMLLLAAAVVWNHAGVAL
ncbi:MAG: DoxX family protein [Halobacteriales archaeon]